MGGANRSDLFRARFMTNNPHSTTDCQVPLERACACLSWSNGSEGAHENN